jgi:NAD(P)H-hydrate epimerase
MSKIPQISEFQGLPVLTPEKMKYIDKVAVMEYGLKENFLMENAGRKFYEETKKYIDEKIKKGPKETKIAVLCGRGNNGGDGVVAARYFKENDYYVKIYIVEPNEKGYGKLVIENLEKAKEKQIPIELVNSENIEKIKEELCEFDIIADALLGISAIGKPTGIIKRLIQIANKANKPIISLDIPSGLSPTTGHHSGVFIKADMTITFGFAKTGLMANHAQKNIGTLKVVDIGYPPELIKKIQESKS